MSITLIKTLDSRHFESKMFESYAGQPSNVETVKRAIMAIRTLSKLKSLLCHTRLWIVGWLTSPSLYRMYVPLEENDQLCGG